MKELIPYLVLMFVVFSISYTYVRVKKGKKILRHHLSENNISWIDMRWILNPSSKANIYFGAYLLFEVITKNGQVKLFLLGSWWLGLINPKINELQ